ncbi:Uncharacterised protein [Vibrio cholerae]|nr:Uncharacterised protein [Vibrio cholerae]
MREQFQPHTVRLTQSLRHGISTAQVRHAQHRILL